MFVVCGEALFDLFGGADTRDLAFDARMGGSPFNVAIGVSRLGQRAALLTGISSDPLGTRLVAELEAEDVHTDMLKRVDQPTTLSVVTVGDNGQPHYAFYGEGAADRSLSEADLPIFGPDVWGVHAGSYSLVVEPVSAALLALFRREKGRRLLTLDPNVRLMVQSDTVIWRERIDHLASYADVIKVSDEDLGLLYTGATSEEVAQSWLSAGTSIVFVTRGASGVEIHRKDGYTAIAGKTVDVVDTVGAGDTFQAGLIAGFAEHGIWSRKHLDEASTETMLNIAEFAVAAAAITCTRRGADLPRRDELSEAVEEPS